MIRTLSRDAFASQVAEAVLALLDPDRVASTSRHRRIATPERHLLRMA
ncbi:hypothetical protein WMF39_28130 [Sorangium sp. So ce1504]